MFVELASDVLLSALAREVMAYAIACVIRPARKQGSVRSITHTARVTTIVSNTIGRVRLRVTGLRGDPIRGRAVGCLLTGLPGVHSAEASSITGTVLVLYTPAEITLDDIRCALEPRRPLAREQVVCPGAGRNAITPADSHRHLRAMVQRPWWAAASTSIACRRCLLLQTCLSH